MMCCVIANLHPMVGVDFHDGFPCFPTNIPIPIVPLAPHIVFAMVRFGPWWQASSSENTNVHVPFGNAMAKGFDIGMLVPHITAPALDSFIYMALDTLMSSSQGFFGVESVQTSQGPIAVALLEIVNLQIDCETPCGLPTGLLLAPSTVVAGLTLGDLLGDLLRWRSQSR